MPLGWPYLVASFLAGCVLLMRPGIRLYRLQEGRAAARLFDQASYYPLAQLAIISILAMFQLYAGGRGVG